MAERKSSTFRVQVSGGKELQKVYEKLSEGDPVELVREGKNNVSVYRAGTEREYLGYLTRSDEIARQIDRGDKILDAQVAGFYMQDWGGQLILTITVQKAG